MTEAVTSPTPPMLRRDGERFVVSIFVDVGGRQIEARAEYCTTFLERILTEAALPALRSEERRTADTLSALARSYLARGEAAAEAGLAALDLHLEEQS